MSRRNVERDFRDGGFGRGQFAQTNSSDFSHGATWFLVQVSPVVVPRGLSSSIVARALCHIEQKQGPMTKTVACGKLGVSLPIKTLVDRRLSCRKMGARSVHIRVRRGSYFGRTLYGRGLRGSGGMRDGQGESNKQYSKGHGAAYFAGENIGGSQNEYRQLCELVSFRRLASTFAEL